MEHLELFRPPRSPGFRIQAGQQVTVALGVKDDHHVTVMNILGGDHLQQPGLAHPGGADDKRVRDPLGLAQRHVVFLLVQPDGVQRGIALDIGPRWERVEQRLAVQRCDRPSAQDRCDGVDHVASAFMKNPQAVKVRILGPVQIGPTLGMPGVPLKAFPQK